MTAFSSVNTTATTLSTNLSTVVANAKSLSDALTPSAIGGLTLTGLATTPKNWRANVADSQVQLTAAIADLASVNDRVQRIAALIANIATLD